MVSLLRPIRSVCSMRLWIVKTSVNVRRATRKTIAIAWLQSWVDEAESAPDEEKAQAEAEWRDLARSIDKSRTSYRKLFPEISSSS